VVFRHGAVLGAADSEKRTYLDLVRHASVDLHELFDTEAFKGGNDCFQLSLHENCIESVLVANCLEDVKLD